MDAPNPGIKQSLVGEPIPDLTSPADLRFHNSRGIMHSLPQYPNLLGSHDSKDPDRQTRHPRREKHSVELRGIVDELVL